MSEEKRAAKPLLSFSEIAKLPVDQRTKESLRLWDALLAKALQKGDFSAALKIAESASEMLRRVR